MIFSEYIAAKEVRDKIPVSGILFDWMPGINTEPGNYLLIDHKNRITNTKQRYFSYDAMKPIPGQTTAEFLLTTEAPIPRLLKNIPMFVYSPSIRTGFFFLSSVTTVPMSMFGKNGPGIGKTTSCLYSATAVCLGAMSEAQSFSTDMQSGAFFVYYDFEHGIIRPR